MKYLSIIIFLLASCCFSLNAQDETPPAIEFEEPKSTKAKEEKEKKEEPVVPGYLNIVVNSQISALINKSRYVSQNQTHVDGWRIQIIQATDKTKVIGLRSKVSTSFPELPSYLDYSQPYFKLRVGNFSNYMNAYKHYKMVRSKYNRASLVRARIPISLVNDRY